MQRSAGWARGTAPVENSNLQNDLSPLKLLLHLLWTFFFSGRGLNSNNKYLMAWIQQKMFIRVIDFSVNRCKINNVNYSDFSKYV